ncbi:hypothetical protein B566_EDAN004261 [Ephemera danica]|nr:hypothetical protein B566_EDAN004261 [Ephemera danica]
MALRTGASFLHFITRMKRFLAGSVLTFMNQQVTMRLLWVLDNIPGLREAVRRGEVMFGTLDTYLLYRLSGGKTHVTDASNASATGMFDPFTMTWATWAESVFNIPFSILPPVGDSAAPSVTVATVDVWGAEIKVSCSMADQGAALFGSCCFTPGDIKVTMGTGAFLNVNTGNKPHASTSGLYPVVGWRIGADTTYVAEGASNDAGTLVNWAINNGLLENPQESAKIANLVPDSDEIFFMPAFNGLQAPINDGRAAAGFLGIRASSNRENLVRAILESIAFRVTQLVRVMHEESDVPQRNIRVDGGVSLNDFVIQLIADLTGHPVERPSSTEMSVLGAGFMAGIAAGVWSSKEELKNLRHIERVFQPNIQRHKFYMTKMAKWERALQRFLCWYDDEQVCF